jgi:hypothetical protein
LDDNIKIDVKEAGCEDVIWIPLAQYRARCVAYVNMGSVKGGEFLKHLNDC